MRLVASTGTLTGSTNCHRARDVPAISASHAENLAGAHDQQHAMAVRTLIGMSGRRGQGPGSTQRADPGVLNAAAEDDRTT